MTTVINKKSLLSTLFITAVFAVLVIFPSSVSAQNNGQNSQCQPPQFQITSSKDVTGLAGESFTYFVVTDGEANYQLTSQLPAGLSFSSGRISGTPTRTGDYPLQFTATNNCGSTTQTVMLSVVSADQLAQAGNESANQQNGQVGLDEVPETGLSADHALTVGFYLLALLMLSGLAARRLYRTPAEAGSDSSRAESDRRRIGSGVDRSNTNSRYE